MAGNYFHDPRPFYGLNHHNLISMDELFYGKKDPWFMHQVPYGQYEDHRSRSVDPRRPEQHIQSHDQYREYRRPDFRDDTYTNFQQEMQHSGKGNPKNGNHGNSHGGNNHGGNHGSNHGGNNHGGNNHGGNNHGGGNHGGGNHGGNQKKQQKYDSDEDYDDFTSNQKSGNKNKGGHDNNHSHNHGNKGNNGHGHNQSTKSWSDNRGFHGGHKHHHRRSLSLTQTVLKKLGLRDDSSSDSSDDERYGSKKNKGHVHGGHGKSDHKPYTVRFDDQSYGPGHGSNQKHKGVHGLGEDHGSHGSHGKKGGQGGQPQGILKKSKNKDDGYSSDEENRGHKNKGGNQHQGGSESGKKGGQSNVKQLGRSQSMDFRVNLCCENCERKVRKSLKYMDDVDQVLCDQWNNRVVVMGNAKPENVLKKLRKVKKDTHLWQHHK